jgi:hypothetical protein
MLARFTKQRTNDSLVPQANGRPVNSKLVRPLHTIMLTATSRVAVGSNAIFPTFMECH